MTKVAFLAIAGTLVLTLLSSGCGGNVPDTTPLHLAVFSGNKAKVLELIKNGADVDAPDKHGDTPLCAAVSTKRKEIAEILVAHGANPSIAARAAVIARDRDMIDFLISKGAAISGDPLVEAVTDRKDMVEFLLERGADVNAPGVPYVNGPSNMTQGTREKSGQTPLSIVALGADEDLLRVLISRGANVRARDASGYAAIHGAARNGHQTIVTLLIENGADVNVKSVLGETPWGLATANGHKEIADLLRKHGAKE